jgi:hypothetical protein
MSTRIKLTARAAFLNALSIPGTAVARSNGACVAASGRRSGRAVRHFSALLALSAAAVTFSAQPSRAYPCSQDIDRAWVGVNAKIQARIAVGRSAPQSTIALLHRQPTQSSIAAAEEALVDVWLPMETAVAALARAREADRARDKIACERALAEAQRAIVQ